MIDDAVVPGGGPRLVVVDVVSASGDADRYLIISEPTRWREPEVGDGYYAALTRWVLAGQPLSGTNGGRFVPAPEPDAVLGPDHSEHFIGDDQTNTIVGVGAAWIVKCYRRMYAGVHPEPELLRTLAEAPATPRLGAEMVFDDGTSSFTVLAVVEHIHGVETGWTGPISRLAQILDAPDDAADLTRSAAEFALLGHAAAVIHGELRTNFPTRAAGHDDRSRWKRTAHADLDPAMRATTGPARAMLEAHRHWIERALTFDSDVSHRLQRIHGDLHLGQFLRRPDLVWIIDFEGDPQSDFGPRRSLDSPLKDLASLLRSLDHLISATIMRRPETRSGERALPWRTSARDAVISAYEHVGGPVDRVLLGAFEVHREIREVSYAAAVLPEWMHAPMFGLASLVESPD